MATTRVLNGTPVIGSSKERTDLALLDEIEEDVRARSDLDGTLSRSELATILVARRLPARLYAAVENRIASAGVIMVEDDHDADGSEGRKDEEGWDRDGLSVFIARTTHKVLSAEEEVALAQRVEVGALAARALAEPGSKRLGVNGIRDLQRRVEDGQRAKAEFAFFNVRLVISIAARYQHRGIELDDLIQEGWIGLAHAVELFDYRKGFKFSTYATWWIHQAIGRAIDNQSRTVRLPAHVAGELRRLERVSSELQSVLGRPPTVDELAQSSGLTQEVVKVLLRSRQVPRSLDVALPNMELTLGDSLRDKVFEDPEEAVVQKDELRWAYLLLKQLDWREREILSRRYGLGYDGPQTLEEIGQALHLTRERIRQIAINAIVHLRTCVVAQAKEGAG